MRKLMFILLLSGCSATSPQLDPVKVSEQFTNLQKIIFQLVPAHNKLITCVIEGKKFEDLKPCLAKTPVPTPTPGK